MKKIGIVSSLGKKNLSGKRIRINVLVDAFFKEGYGVKFVSTVSNRFLKTLDIISFFILQRKWLDVVLIEAFTGKAFIIAEIGSLLSKYIKKPFIIILHGGNFPKFAKKNFKRIKRVLLRADIIIAPSKYLADFFSDKGFNVQIIPNALEIEEYPYAQKEKLKPNIIWMRAFHELYNPKMAIDIFQKVQEIWPDATLTMAGRDKGLLSFIEGEVKEKGLKDKVRFVGFLGMQEKRREFYKHDIFLNTSRVDNMPVTLLEAAAFGTPIVTTNIGGIPYMFKDKETALMFNDGDILGAVNAIKYLLEEEEEAKDLSKKARILAEKLSWSNVKDKWKQLFEVTPCLK